MTIMPQHCAYAYSFKNIFTAFQAKPSSTFIYCIGFFFYLFVYQFISARNKSQCIFNSYNFRGAQPSLFFSGSFFQIQVEYPQTFHAVFLCQGEINIPPIRHKMKFLKIKAKEWFRGWGEQTNKALRCTGMTVWFSKSKVKSRWEYIL